MISLRVAHSFAFCAYERDALKLAPSEGFLLTLPNLKRPLLEVDPHVSRFSASIRSETAPRPLIPFTRLGSGLFIMALAPLPL